MDILRRVLYICAVLSLTLCSHLAGAAPKALVVLIPGFGSSILHEIPPHDLPPESVSPYFSATVAGTMIEAGYDVLALKGMGSAADFAVNGGRAISQINEYMLRYQGNPPPVYLLGHSMGGLLSLYVTNEIGFEVPIKKIILLSTPLRGSKVANKIANGIIPLRVAEKAAEALSGIVDLRGIVQMTTPKVDAFIAQLRLPAGIDIRAFSGVQPRNKLILPSWDAPIQSPLYIPFAKLVGEDSDGVVGLSSSLPKTMAIPSIGKNRLMVQSEPLVAELDHEEQHMDYRVIEDLFQTDEVDFIDQKQREFYQHMIRCWELPSCMPVGNK